MAVEFGGISTDNWNISFSIFQSDKIVPYLDSYVAFAWFISESERDMCVQDVLAADDLEMAGIYTGA